MLVRATLAAAFGLLAFSPAGVWALPTPPAVLPIPSDIVLAQANDDEDEKSSRRDRRGADKADRRSKAKEQAEDAKRSRRERQEAQEQERAKRNDEAKTKSEARREERDARRAKEAEAKTERRDAAEKARQDAREARDERRDAAEKARQDARKAREERRAKEVEARTKQQQDAAEKAKQEAAEKARTERRSKARPDTETEAKPQRREAEDQARPERRRGDRDRARRRDRDDSAFERMRRREAEKTPARELRDLKVGEGRTVVIDGGARTARREGNRLIIRSDDTRRLGSSRDERRVERLPGGQTRTIIIRPDGTRIIEIRDARGETIRRSRRYRDGREVVLFGRMDRPRRRPLVELNLGPLRVNMPREQYFYEYRHGAPRRDLERVLRAPPVQHVNRSFSLEEIRTYKEVRDLMPRVDFSEITFDTDSAYISPEQIDLLEDIADVMLEMIEENPETVFMIAGYTDATGPYDYNVVLSLRRAEAVAIALSDYFEVPGENLVVEGFGPESLKINTPHAERRNRRVEFMNATYLLAEH